MTAAFEHPGILWALVILAPFTIVSLARLAALSKKMPAALLRRTVFSAIFFALFLIFTILALAAPRGLFMGTGGGQADGAVHRTADVVFAIDVSRSMDIRDIADNGTADSVSRLGRGVAVARETASGLPGVRFAAVSGRTRSMLAVPLTPDANTVLNFLDAAGAGSSSTGRGTNIESLLDTAAGAFQDSSPAHRYIVLISDGETLSGSISAAAERCGRLGISVISLALGSDSGQPAPGQESYISSRDQKAMHAVADITKGLYVDGNRGDAVLLITQYVRSRALVNGADASGDVSHWFICIIAAILMYGASVLCMCTLKRKRRTPKLLAVLAALILCISCQDISGKILVMEGNYHSSGGRYTRAILAYQKALADPGAAPYAQAGLGIVYYYLDETQAALNSFTDSQRLLDSLLDARSSGPQPSSADRELRYRNNYNSGVVMFARGDYSGAAASFRDALRVDSNRIDAKRNLELSLLSQDREKTRGKAVVNTPEEIQSRDALFQYLGHSEQNRWRSLELAPEDQYEGPDY